jgi:hypothetical protein
MRKVAFDKRTADCQYFFANGYWLIGDEDTIIPTEKWRMLFDTCIRNVTKKGQKIITFRIITPEDIQEAIASNPQRSSKKKGYYKKIQRPEGYKTCLQRKIEAHERALAKELKKKVNGNTRIK